MSDGLGLKRKLRWNVISEVANVSDKRGVVEVESGYIIMCYKSIIKPSLVSGT